MRDDAGPDQSEADLPELGSLAQQVRLQRLGIARVILVSIGLLVAGGWFSLYLFAGDVARLATDQRLQAIGGRENLSPEHQDELQQIEGQTARSIRVTALVFTGVGLLFLLLGACVKAYPVPITITALVVFLAGVAIALAGGAGSMPAAGACPGLVAVVVIFLALAKAMQTAIEYEEDRRKSLREPALKQENAFAPETPEHR